MLWIITVNANVITIRYRVVRGTRLPESSLRNWLFACTYLIPCVLICSFRCFRGYLLSSKRIICRFLLLRGFNLWLLLIWSIITNVWGILFCSLSHSKHSPCWEIILRLDGWGFFLFYHWFWLWFNQKLTSSFIPESLLIFIILTFSILFDLEF